MSSTALTALAPATRTRAAAGLFGFAVLFAVVGALAVVSGAVVLVVLGVLALLVAVTLALAGWGLRRSVALEAAERELDAAVEYAMAAHGGMCSCGHDHDPEELHITDACAHDGAGTQCAHDCSTCVLSALRP